ncbi:IclR family transcriptional regulator domain-containing protein [Actinospica durhamensis]|uniref:IclR family transcriptional regulator domain-containing protein n=1 Tax=Actinospica durhamensis TaxID=1508375 RepID=UPI001FE922DF|nr:IclR family transcriptional regulator C-terminal domain-containing protein [Actinospica durhamensis]
MTVRGAAAGRAGTAAPLPHPDESVGPLERGFAVLRALANAPGGRLRASELTRGTGLARSTVDRVATTLVELGALRAEGDGRDLVLAPAAARLGGAYLRGSALPGTLGPLARELAARLDESVSLAVADRDAVRFIVQIKRRRALSVAFRAGDALPAERCAPGALFAADWDAADFEAWHARLAADPSCDAFAALPRSGRATEPRPPEPAQVEAAFRARIERAARDGWAEDDQLIEQGLIAAAVPVYDPAGAQVCALSVVSHTSRQTVRSLAETVLPAMRACAARMTEALAARPGHAANGAPTPTEPEPHEPNLDPTAAAKEQHGPGYLQSLARGISVLSALGGGGPAGMTLSEAAAATGLPRATARRALLTSARQGYVATDGHRFKVLPRVLELGYARLSQLSLGELAQPHLAEVVAAVHESASMAVLDGADIRYVARAAAGRIMSVDIMVGTRFPAYATSMGRVLLADLPGPERLRRLEQTELIALTPHTVTDRAALARVLDAAADEGCALVDQELEEGLRSIAVPVRDPSGRAVAAVNVSMHAARTSAAQARAVVLPILLAAASRISTDLALVSDAAASMAG